jgi:hypothetical protein
MSWKKKALIGTGGKRRFSSKQGLPIMSQLIVSASF